MKNATAITRDKSVALDTVSIGNGQIGVGVIGVASVLIGCWAVVSLIAGMVTSGGPAELLSNLFKAITG
ncbi:hypothetical protein [Desulforhopalus sp. IMCC35007]|uniref:hypothetical protein n=1 Tax=Desulforhopalus sp. IMCC35007 TaxID=2569543 RepID=UPI0010AE11E1|nr:hypothetical protein [Desulforhopalus sp. IMCC35007]TKB06436.1 hypothetical protein FCL48_20815 [Desulforhopalus sp. IMCC35007]